MLFLWTSAGPPRTPPPTDVLGKSMEEWLAELDTPDSTEIRSQVVMALATFGTPSINPLVERLQTPRPLVNSAALEALAWMGPDHPDAIAEALKPLLEIDDPYLPTQAAQALAILGDPAVDALPKMVALWDRPIHAGQRFGLLHAVSSFRDLDPAAVRDALLSALPSEDEWIRQTAEGLLKSLDDDTPPALPEVRDAGNGQALDRWFSDQLDRDPGTPLPVTTDPRLSGGMECFNRTPLCSFPCQSSASFSPPTVLLRENGVDLHMTWSSSLFRCEAGGLGVGMRLHQTYRGRVIVQLRSNDSGKPQATVAAWRMDNKIPGWKRVTHLTGDITLQRLVVDGAENPAFLRVRSANALGDIGSLWMYARSRLIPNHRSRRD